MVTIHGSVDAAQERMIFQPPVRIGRTKHLVERARLFDLRSSGPAPNTCASRSGVIDRHRVEEPCQAAGIARQQRAQEIRGPRHLLARPAPPRSARRRCRRAR